MRTVEPELERVASRRGRALVMATVMTAFVLVGAATGGSAEGDAAPGSEASESAEPADPLTAEMIGARREQLAKERGDAERALEQAVDEDERVHLEEVVERLRGAEGLVREQEEEWKAVEITPAAGADVAAENASVFALNELLEVRGDQARTARQQQQRLEASRRALAAAKEKFAGAEQRRRAAKRELADAPSVLAARRHEISVLESGMEQERVHLWALATKLAGREPGEGADESVEERIRLMRQELEAGSVEDSAGFAPLVRREGKLLRAKADAERQLASAELVVEAARTRFSRGPDPAGARLAEAEALTAVRDAVQQRVGLATAQIDRSEAQRIVWRQWAMTLAGSVTRDELDSWTESTAERIEALRLEELQREGRLADLERLRSIVRDRLEALPAGSSVRGARQELLTELGALLEAERDETVTLAFDRRVAERLLVDLEDRNGHVDVAEYFDDSVEAVGDFWDYEVAAVEDSAITIGSLILALTFAGLGLWGSRRGSASVGRIAQRRLRLDSGAAHALETLSFYVLFVSFILMILRLVHFPLTVFTVLGGALAIGAGFGSQNVMNNFISGLILLFERPVRAGDVVEVEGNYGTVETIGARSTRIRSTDGRHIIVPNSFFLESNVVNWTLSDDLVRTTVSVGVIYGSPTRLVEERIRQAVDEDPQVLSTPEPAIVFAEFGDNSLNFDVHFWVRARSPTDTKRVASQIRFRIDDLFREDGLVIAFPQRDVHIDSVSPVQVEFVRRTRSAGASPKKSEGA